MVDAKDNADEIALKYQPRSPLKLFAAKAAMTGVVVIVAAWFVTGFVVDAIGDLLDQRIRLVEQRIRAALPAKVGGREFWTAMERELARAADPANDLSPQKKQKIIADLHAVSDRWRPFLMEASSAVIGNSSSSSVKRE